MDILICNDEDDTIEEAHHKIVMDILICNDEDDTIEEAHHKIVMDWCWHLYLYQKMILVEPYVYLYLFLK
jgi:hypothetical protein